MPIVVNTNVASLNAQRYLNINAGNMQKTMERLSSGFRINRAGDDAAGLSLSERLRAQIRGSQKALANVQDGLGVLNIADGAFQTITESLQRMRELAVQAANDTYNTQQRSALQAEYDQLVSGIDQIANSTQFNGVNLLTGSNTTAALQIGANATANDSLTIGTSVFATGTTSGLNANLATMVFTAGTNARSAIIEIDAALATLNTRRGTLGALYNRLEKTGDNLAISVENLSASESRIRNVDVAAESANMVRNQILQQASASMLSQANQAPSLALSLLGG